MRPEITPPSDPYAQFPTSGDRPEAELAELERLWCRPTGWRWLAVINNRYVGVYYVGAAMLFFVLAGILALLIRTQLAVPMHGFLAQETYNQVFTMHGTMMMFLFAVPAVAALGVTVLPQMLGARDMPFPRLSAYAFWAYLMGGLAFFSSLFFGLAPNGGWFMYPPLINMTYSPGINVDFWLIGIGFIEISAIAGAIEIIVGILRNRAPGMTLDKMPVFAWAMLIFAVMIIIAFPAMILASLLMELERALNWPFFDSVRGGDPLLWQHLFWFFGHPEVYIIFLPAAGAMSTLIPVVAQTRLVGHRLVVLAMLATGFISFGVWAHHMFTTGMPTISVSYFSAASMAVSIPAGVQVFAWIATMAAGKMRFNTMGLFAVGGLVTFVMGGLTGVMVAMVPFDWQAHDSYFIVAHMHYVLIGGMVLPLFAAIYYWTPFVSSRPLSETWGKWVFWLTFTGFHVTFLPMHLTGLMGMPRRVYTYLPDRGWDIPNMISTVGSVLTAVGVLLWVIDMARNFRPFAARTAGNVWKAPGLEWLPMGSYSARSMPVVRSLYPQWDDPSLKVDVPAGRYFLPKSATGRRETLITSSIDARPMYLLRLPVPSGWPIWGAVFTAGAFVLLAIQAYGPSFVSGVLAIYCLFSWCWTLDKPWDQPTAHVGGGVVVPTYQSGPAGHGWWGMVLTLVCAGMVCSLAAFSYVFLWSRNPSEWLVAPGLGTLPSSLAPSLAGALLAWGAPRVLRMPRPRAPIVATLMIVAAFALIALGWWTAFAAWRALDIDPTAHARFAMVYFFTGWTGVFTAISALMTLFVALRLFAGLVSRLRPSTFDLVTLFMMYTAIQGVATTALTVVFPGR